MHLILLSKYSYFIASITYSILYSVKGRYDIGKRVSVD